MPKYFEPNMTQAPFIQSLARFIGFIGGIGSGKTTAGAIKALVKISQGEPGIVVGPDFPHFSKSTWPEFAKWIPWSQVKNRNLEHPYTNRKVLEFQVGKLIVPVYYGGIDEPESWTGPSVNWFWFDEGRRKATRMAFDVLCGRIRVGNNPQGWVTTSPRGRSHWLFDVFVKGVFPKEVVELFARENRKIVEFFTASTTENAKHLDKFYYASLAGLYEGTLRKQELGGEFVTFEGAVWENFESDPKKPLTNVTLDADFVPGVPVEWAVDDGFTKGHPRVILFAQVIPPWVNIFDEYIAHYELGETSISNALAKGWPRPTVAYCDSSAAELINRVWAEEIDTVRASHSVTEGIKHTAAFIRDGNQKIHVRFHPRCDFSINEIISYCYPEEGESRAGSEKPLKASDNAADALRYLLWSKQIDDLEEDAKVPQRQEQHGGRVGHDLSVAPPPVPVRLPEAPKQRVLVATTLPDVLQQYQEQWARSRR